MPRCSRPQIASALALTLLLSACPPALPRVTFDETRVTRDARGNPTHEDRYDRNGKRVSSTDYERDAKGKVTKKTSHSFDKNGKPTTVQVIEYDEEGRERVITHEIYGADGKVKVKVRQTTTYRDKDDATGSVQHETWNPDRKKWEPGMHTTVGMARPAYGLLTTTFTTASGKIAVNLPDDLAAGDTISGTVIAEPAGKDSAEKDQNASELNGYVVEAVPAGQRESGELSGVVREHPRTTPQERRLRWAIPAASVGVALLVLRDRQGKIIDRAPLPCPTHPSETPVAFQLPETSVAGKPLCVHGPFEATEDTTQVRLGGERAEILASSPRQCVVQPPFVGTGPASLELETGGKRASGTCRVLGIRLSANKAILERGESGIVSVTVLGLAGLTRPTALVLVNRTPGMVTLSGGDWQRVSIAPSQVQDGQFHHTLTMTAVRPGRYLLQAGIPGAFADGPLEINNNEDDGLPLSEEMKKTAERVERDRLYEARRKAREAREKADKAKGTDARAAREDAEKAEKAAREREGKTSREAIIATHELEEKELRKAAAEAGERAEKARASEQDYREKARQSPSLRKYYEEQAEKQKRLAEGDEAQRKALEKQADAAHKELERARTRTIAR